MLVFVSDILATPVKISGQPVANLVASTSGTDSDWVVKLIDVSPDEVADQPKMGGYQLKVSADIFRGRYRESFSTPKPIPSGEPLLYRFACRRRTTSSCPGIGSWSRSSRAGSRSMTATRRLSSTASSGPSPGTTARGCSGCTTRPATRASSSCLWSCRHPGGSCPAAAPWCAVPPSGPAELRDACRVAAQHLVEVVVEKAPGEGAVGFRDEVARGGDPTFDAVLG